MSKRKKQEIEEDEVQLEPPDLKRCQADRPNGYSFMTLGGKPGLERCKDKPTVIVHELVPGKDGQKGSMSLCTHCFGVFCMQMHPTKETYRFEEIK